MSVIAKIKGKLAYWKRGIAVFIRTSNDNNCLLKYPSAINYKEFTQLDMIENYNFTKEEKLLDYKIRFSKKEILCVLEKENQILVSGWINPNPMHNIGELALIINEEGNFEVLYDFETKKAFRGQGLYPILLNEIIKRNKKTKVIYALVSNMPSVKGIKKAGFKHLGNVYGINKNKVHNLLRKRWQD